MVQAPAKIDPQLVYLDPFLMDRSRLNAGLSRKKLATLSGLAVNTVLEAFTGRGLQPEKARLLAKHLGCQVVELLAPWDPRYAPPTEPPGPWNTLSEWETAGYMEQGRLAANGLYYIVCRMRHRHTPGRQGRGKFYHLSWLPPTLRSGMQSKLSRHAEVCDRVGRHPHVITNLSSTPTVGEDGWWVIDEWVGEKSLAEHLQSGPVPSDKLPRLLFDSACGLEALHGAGIVFRELAPARILIADDDGRAVLTDFELARLLDGSPSVSSEWPEDPFRAPEVDGGDASIQADLYSLSCVAAAAISGEAIRADEVLEILRQATFPKPLLRLLVACSEPIPARRPDSLAPLIKELARWAEK
jgi:serine/threonine protein kinase